MNISFRQDYIMYDESITTADLEKDLPTQETESLEADTPSSSSEVEAGQTTADAFGDILGI